MAQPLSSPWLDPEAQERYESAIADGRDPCFDTVVAMAGRIERLRAGLARLDAISRASVRTPRGEAEFDAALDDAYWLLHPEKTYSVADKANRDAIEARLVEGLDD